MKFLPFFIICIFVFSTFYTLYFYYNEGAGVYSDINGLEDETPDPGEFSPLGLFDGVLDIISWISPFALVKGIMLATMPEDLYQVFNHLFLRPIGWISTAITANYIISKIPAISGE